jgi:hypothetical protein
MRKENMYIYIENRILMTEKTMASTKHDSKKFSKYTSFLPLGVTVQGELWPPEQSASILLYIHPRLTVWFPNNLVFMV